MGWGAILTFTSCSVLGPGLATAQADERAPSRDVAGLRWSIVPRPDCPPRSCWQVRVTARATSCPHGLYLSLNQWTQADLLSTTNVFLSEVAAVLPRVRGGQTVIVTLPRSARTAEGASLSEINCY